MREDVQCQVMRYYGRLGDRNSVIRHYRRLEEILADELGVDPMPETQNLYRILVTGETVSLRTEYQEPAENLVRNR